MSEEEKVTYLGLGAALLWVLFFGWLVELLSRLPLDED